MELFGDVLFWLIDRMDRWLDGVALRDRWRFSVEARDIAEVRSSIYVDDEMWWSSATGPAEASGLSGSHVGARSAHRILVVVMDAGNSGRVCPVVLFNRNTDRAQILEGNFAPMLRSRFEGRILLAGLVLGVLSFVAGIMLLLLGGGSLNPGLVFMSAPLALVALAILFTGKRRKRLRVQLQARCAVIVAQLRAGQNPAGEEVVVA